MNIRSMAGSARALAVMAVVLMIAGSTAMFGQQITGTIVGTVKDQQGAVVNTATVKATNVDTGFTRSAPDKRLWGIPNRLPSRGQVHRRGDGGQL